MHANLNVDSEVTWATRDRPDGPVMLYDVYKINYTWPVISTFSGQWDSVSGLVYHVNRSKYIRRGDLQGLLFHAAVSVRLENITESVSEFTNFRLMHTNY